MSARKVLTLLVCGDLPSCFAAQRSAGEAAVAVVARLTGAAFFERVAMAMVVGDWRGVLTFRKRKRLIALRKNERRDSLPTPRLLLWLRRVSPIVGARGGPAAGCCWMWFEFI